MTTSVDTLGPATLEQIPASVLKPGYDRNSVKVGMAHIGVGAFHRCHQAEYTDDLLGQKMDRWGVVGINIRNPRLADTLGRQDGLYTRLIRQDDRVEARIIGSIVKVVDSQDGPGPALGVLASAEIDVVTMTVTEKGYCHKPSTGELDLRHPDIVHDLAHPDAPRSVPGLITRALQMRMQSHDQPITVMSCDNIPSNGAILSEVVATLADRIGGGLPEWIAANAAFPSSMVDRIAPATSAADIALVEERYGYRDSAVVVGEPFKQWVIENRFAGRFPRWDLVGATFVDDVTPFEHLKMRVLNGTQTTMAYLGVLAGYEHTSDDMTDPLLVDFVRRMLVEETLPTLEPVPGMSPELYVEQSLERLRNTAIKHRNHQIATDGSQKIVQRLLSPILTRLRRGEGITLLSVPVAAWMVYLIRASERFGKAWTVDDPFGATIASIADRVGHHTKALAAEILAIEAIFDPELASNATFRKEIIAGLDGLMGNEPLAYVRRVSGTSSSDRLNPARQTG